MSSAKTQVLNNTVFVSGTYPTPIEYRFRQSAGVVVANNLLDGAIQARDGATGTQRNNLERAGADRLAGPASGNFHLARTAADAIDRGMAVPEVTEDWDGEPRPQGGAYDIGADEWSK